ncbi:hypothetical protein A8B98_18560 [Hymenobacter sp. UV11]|nr:hypothetical protein A8B98_18560 [Hymenobacter sp. UV11]
MLGTIEGSAGGLTFSSTAGVNLLRQKVGSNNSKSPLQVQQRTKFAEIGRLAKAIGSLLLAGYKRVGFQSGYNQFVGQNIAFTSLDQNGMAIIDYSRLSVSTGSVAPLLGLTMANSATGKTISWTDNSDGNQALASDKVYVAIVRTATMEVAESLGSVTRAAGSVQVTASYLAGVAAGELAVYAFARRADNTDASPTASIATAPAGGGSAQSFGTNISGPSGTAAGTTLTASAGDRLSFNELTTGSSGPYNMTISVGGQQVASVDTYDRYAGRPFSFTHAGVAHTGAFAAVVNF